MEREPTQQPIRSTIDKKLDGAIRSQKEEHEAELPEKKTFEDLSPDQPSQPGPEDKGRLLKLAGGMVAVVAVIALGGFAVKQKQGKSRKQRAEEEAQGLLGGARQGLKRGGRWLGGQADASKQAAGEAAGSVKEAVEGAVPSQVGDKAAVLKEQAHITGIKAEREGLKASEKSDAAVRRAAAGTGDALKGAREQSAGVFGPLKRWLAARKDDAVDAGQAAAHKVGQAADAAGNAVRG